MKRVLYITYDGILEPLGESQVLNYLESLSGNHQIHLLSFEKKEDIKNINKLNNIKKRCSSSKIQWFYITYRKSILGTFYNILTGVIYSIFVEIRHKKEIVHTRSYLSSLIGLVLKVLFGTKFLFDMRGLWADEKVDSGVWLRKSVLFKVSKKLEKFFLIKADKVISLTESGIKEIKTFNYLKNKKIDFQVIRTCTNLSLFNPTDKKEETNNLMKDKFFRLGYVGSVSLWYMFEEVLDFFKAVKEIKPLSIMHIVNKGEHCFIRQTLKKYSFTNEDIILETVNHSQVADSMKKMDAGIFFIKPYYSKIASAPTKLGEFLAMGIPCVTNKGIGDTSKIIEYKKSGILLDDFKRDSLFRGAEQLLILKDEENILNRCRLTAEKYFSLEEGIKKYNKVYESL